MKRQAQNTESFVHAYGCGAILSGEEWIEHEASLMAELWDQLVDIERRFERGIEAAASQDDPVIRETLAAIETLSAGIAAASPTERKPLVEQRRALRRTLWEPLAAWRRGHKDVLKTLNRERIASVIAARQATERSDGNPLRLLQLQTSES